MPFTDLVILSLTYGFFLLLGVILADICSGFVHWFIDQYGNPKWPFIGAFIEDNQRHHRAPNAFLLHGFMKRNVGAMVIVAVLFVLFWGLDWLNIVTLTALIVGSFGNEIHGFSHRNVVPWPVKALRSVGLLQSRRSHMRHHIGNQDEYYCVITAWLNPFLDRFDIWARMERVIERVFKVAPHQSRQAV